MFLSHFWFILGICQCHANYSGTFCHACQTGFYYSENKCFQYPHFEKANQGPQGELLPNFKKWLTENIVVLVIGGPWLMVCCCVSMGHVMLSKVEAEIERQTKKSRKTV